MPDTLRPTLRCGTPTSTVAVRADGARFLWAGGSPGAPCPVTVCDARGKAALTLSGHRKPIIRSRFLADGSVVSASFDAHVCRWTPEGEQAASNDCHLDYRADGFDVTADGVLAVVGDYRGGVTGWRTADGSQAFAWKENERESQIWAVAIDPGAMRLLTGGADGTIRVWGLGKRRAAAEIVVGTGCHVRGLTWHPDGRSFAAAVAPDGRAPAGSTSRVAIFDATSLNEVTSLPLKGHQPSCCAFSPDGLLLAAGGGGTDRGGGESKANCVVRVWDVASGTMIAELAGHTGLVRDLAFWPTAKRLLSAGWDGTVRVWDLPAATRPK